MTTNIDRLDAAVSDYLALHIKHAGAGRSKFRATFTMFVADKPMPVLVLGVADGSGEDGDAVGILNPDQELLEVLGPNISQASIKELVTGRCDGMVHVFYEAYTKPAPKSTRIGKYFPRAEMQPPKFDVR